MTDVIIRDTRTLAPTSQQIDYLLLDSSSSMTPRWWDALASIDAYILELRSKGIDSRTILAAFSDADLQYIWRDGPTREIKLMSEDPIGHFAGKTPLYDAINSMSRRLKELNPPQCSVVILTDGEEIGSRFTTLEQARQLLDWMRLRGWTVSFIGCDFDNSSMAKLMGGEKQSLGTSAKRLADAMKLLADRRARYGHTGEGIEFSDAERSRFGGYLGAPS